MASELYALAMKLHRDEVTQRLEEMSAKCPGLFKRCPDCNRPMLTFASRLRWGVGEYLCPEHGMKILPLEV